MPLHSLQVVCELCCQLPCAMLQGGASVQELQGASSASPVINEAKHLPGKPVKQEDSKPDPVMPPASGISTDALNRLIAMGGPAGQSRAAGPHHGRRLP